MIQFLQIFDIQREREILHEKEKYVTHTTEVEKKNEQNIIESDRSCIICCMCDASCDGCATELEDPFSGALSITITSYPTRSVTETKSSHTGIGKFQFIHT